MSQSKTVAAPMTEPKERRHPTCPMNEMVWELRTRRDEEARVEPRSENVRKLSILITQAELLEVAVQNWT